jgi:4-hydroxy 2-oxovalerate aldolase
VVNEITLLDVTLRDGGYVNGHSWTRTDAMTVVAACEAAQLSYSEIGYFRPARHETDGAALPAACCPPDYVRALHEQSPSLTLIAMVHGRDVDLDDYRKLHDLGIGMVRMPAQLGILPTLPRHVEAAKNAGLRVTLNLIRVSELTTEEVVRAATLAEECGVEAFYLADSNGGLFPDKVTELVRASADAVGIPLGFHAHDGLSLAFINSLTALQAGCTYLDASLAGMGKGGGNLSLELIVGYLISRQQARHQMAPLVHAADTVLKPWKDGVAARCDSIASGLLDLNIDNIKAHLDSTNSRELVSIVDGLVPR